MAESGIQHVVWDWNGTILDDADACVATLNILLSARGLPTVDRVQYMESFRFPVKDYYIGLGIDFELEDWDAMAVEFHRIYGKEVLDAGLRDGAAETLEQLQRGGVPMSVLSASPQGVLEGQVARAQLRDYFGIVVGLSDIYAHSKLDAGHELIRRLEMDPASVLLVGDTDHDCEVAQKLECSCVLVNGGHQALHRLRACPCPVLSDITELPGILLL